MYAEAARAINRLSTFVSNEQISGVQDVNRFLRSLGAHDTNAAPPTDVLVLCVSSVLSVADTVLSAIAKHGADGLQDGVDDSEQVTLQENTLIVVLCGGIGHSSPYVYEAVAQHERYGKLAGEVQGLPEARVLQLIAERFYGLQVSDFQSDANQNGKLQSHSGLSIIVEDTSTNCGANAIETRKVLEAHGIASPRSIIVAQDPTMCRRTVASFEKVYEGSGVQAPRVASWPTFVPQVDVKGEKSSGASNTDVLDRLDFSENGETGARRGGLWEMRRFVNLLMGEIPRLRDDEGGYGPRGKNFIAHVDIPEEIEDSWTLLGGMLDKADSHR